MTSGAEDHCTKFETRHNLGRGDIAGDAAYEDMADRLIEDQFDRNARIGAGENCGERLLPLGCLGMKQFEVVLMGGPATVDIALVAVHQFLEGGVGAKRALRQRSARGREFRPPVPPGRPPPFPRRWSAESAAAIEVRPAPADHSLFRTEPSAVRGLRARSTFFQPSKYPLAIALLLRRPSVTLSLSTLRGQLVRSIPDAANGGIPRPRSLCLAQSAGGASVDLTHRFFARPAAVAFEATGF